MAKRSNRARHRQPTPTGPLPLGWSSWDGLEEAHILEGFDIAPDKNGVPTVTARRARVLRLKVPRALQAMTVEQRGAMLEYARLVETCGSTGGALSGLSGGGGGGGRVAQSTPPNLAKLEAASALRVLHGVLDDRAVEFAVTGPGGRPINCRLPFADLARMIAVDHMTRADIAAAMGVDIKSPIFPQVAGAIAMGTRDTANLFAACFGYLPSEPGAPQIRNTPGLMS